MPAPGRFLARGNESQQGAHRPASGPGRSSCWPICRASVTTCFPGGRDSQPISDTALRKTCTVSMAMLTPSTACAQPSPIGRVIRHRLIGKRSSLPPRTKNSKQDHSRLSSISRAREAPAAHAALVRILRRHADGEIGQRGADRRRAMKRGRKPLTTDDLARRWRIAVV